MQPKARRNEVRVPVSRRIVGGRAECVENPIAAEPTPPTTETPRAETEGKSTRPLYPLIRSNPGGARPDGQAPRNATDPNARTGDRRTPSRANRGCRAHGQLDTRIRLLPGGTRPDGQVPYLNRPPRTMPAPLRSGRGERETGRMAQPETEPVNPGRRPVPETRAGKPRNQQTLGPEKRA